MMDEVKGLSDAIQVKAWYPLVAYAVALLIRIITVWKPRLLEEVDGKPPLLPKRIQWLPAVLIAAGTALWDGFSAGYSWQTSLILVVYAAATGGPGAVGVYRIGKETFKKTAKVTAALLLLALPLGLSACAEVKPYLRTANDYAPSVCAAFFSQKQGISVEQAAELFCKTQKQLQPWIDQLLSLEKQGLPDPSKQGCAATEE